MNFLRRECGAENRAIMRSRVGWRERASGLSEMTAKNLVLYFCKYIGCKNITTT